MTGFLEFRLTSMRPAVQLPPSCIRNDYHMRMSTESNSWMQQQASQALIISLILVAGLATTSIAETNNLDGPAYVPGTRPPKPWTDSYAERGDTTHTVPFTVVAGRGVGGSQALEVPDTGLFEGYAVYLLPQPLTSADGPRRISVKYDPPQPAPDGYMNFLTYGGAWIGNGWMQIDTGHRVGILFKLEDWGFKSYNAPEDFKVFTPAGQLGTFVPSVGANYHELVFELNAAWDTMTFTVVTPGGASLSNSYAWDGSPIDKVWLGPATDQYVGQTAAYDDLVVDSSSAPAPEIEIQPASFATVSAGGRAEFSVQAKGGDDLEYQWQLNGNPIEGATSATYVIPSVDSSHVGEYRVVVSSGGKSVTSDPSVLSLVGVNTCAVVVLEGPVGAKYRIDYTDDIEGASGWQLWTNVTLSASPQALVDFGSNHSHKRFYRTEPQP